MNTLAQLRAACRKAETDPLFLSGLFYRRLSIHVTRLVLMTPMTSSQVTVLSGVFAVAASFLTLWPSATNYALSAVALQCFIVLDHVDGEVARARRESNWAGSYLDRLIHYFQGPSLFACLGGGLALLDRSPLWLVAGVLAAVGSGGFPRFVAAYELLKIGVEPHNAPLLPAVRQMSDYYAIYGARTAAGHPGTIARVLAYARQSLTFPGHLILFSAIALVQVLKADAEFPAIKAYLASFAVILTVNTLYASHRYYVELTRLDRPAAKAA